MSIHQCFFLGFYSEYMEQRSSKIAEKARIFPGILHSNYHTVPQKGNNYPQQPVYYEFFASDKIYCSS